MDYNNNIVEQFTACTRVDLGWGSVCHENIYIYHNTLIQIPFDTAQFHNNQREYVTQWTHHHLYIIHNK